MLDSSWVWLQTRRGIPRQPTDCKDGEKSTRPAPKFDTNKPSYEKLCSKSEGSGAIPSGGDGMKSRKTNPNAESKKPTLATCLDGRDAPRSMRSGSGVVIPTQPQPTTKTKKSRQLKDLMDVMLPSPRKSETEGALSK